MIGLPDDIASAPESVQDHYRQMIESGVAPSLAEMLALRHPPGAAGLDSTFWHGQGHADQFNGSAYGKRVREGYRKITGHYPVGMRYINQLAPSLGHPAGWVSSVGDLKRRVAEQGAGCEAPGVEIPIPASTIERLHAEAEKPYTAAPNLVNKRFAQELRKNPELARASKTKKAEAKHKIRERLSGRGPRNFDYGDVQG